VAALLVCLGLSTYGCSESNSKPLSLDLAAEDFVKLALAVGQHDADYVDAYFGPEEWRTAVEQEVPGLDEILARAGELAERITAIPVEQDDDMARQRHLRLAKTLDTLAARTRFLAGERQSFDEESAALFDAVAPVHESAHFQAILDRLDAALPGDGSLPERYGAFKEDFVIPSDKLDEVFQAAIDACRQRTRAFIDLPESENFIVEYVTDKSWSGYNWYQGDYQSLIQVNTDLPIFIDRALDLACHEGYPGHHVFNLLLEKNLLRDRGWSEFFVYPLFGPRSLIAEGTANFGIDVAFPTEERIAFERQTLFPLAGLDPDRVAEYYEVGKLIAGLNYAGNEAARGYLDETMTADQAVDWLMTYSLMAEPRARQRLSFIDQYRSYVINYNLGQDLVRDYIESRGGTAENAERRWQLFADLLSNPLLPSQLQ
jgi:hypothetical protein